MDLQGYHGQNQWTKRSNTISLRKMFSNKLSAKRLYILKKNWINISGLNESDIIIKW